MEDTTNTLEIQEHGLMMSDYFNGTPGVMLVVYLSNETTKLECIEMLEEDINQLWDHVEYTAEYHNFNGDLEAQIDEQLKTMKEYIKDKENELICPDMEIPGDDEQAVFIFSIEFMKE